VAADGVSALGNTNHGVAIDGGLSNRTGGLLPGAGNIIAFNGGNGVHVDGSVPQVRSNTIRGNSIYSNVSAGIALTANGNDNIAPPVITSANALGASGTSCAQCYVEIFSDNHDEGRIFEGVVFTNDGNWMFSGSLTGPYITATQTDVSANTSPFSVPFNIVQPTPTPSPTPSATPSPVVTPTPTPGGTSRIWGDVDCGGDIAPRDAQAILKNVLVQNALSQTQPCPAVGSQVTVDGVSRIWGDVDCGGTVAPRDAQAVLKNVLAQNALSQTQPCPAVGSTVQVVG
jgi:hypothetical protein